MKDEEISSEEINFEPYSIITQRMLALYGFFILVFVVVGLGYIIITPSEYPDFLNYAAIPMAVVFVLVAYISLMGQASSYDKLSKKFVYTLKMKDMLYRKKPYDVINYDDVARVKKITNHIGKPVLLKIFEKDKVHYLGEYKMIKSILYEFKKRDMEDLIHEDRRKISWLEVIFIRTRGGKMEVRGK